MLHHVNVPDTSTVKAATEALQTRFLKNTKVVPALFEIIATSPDLAVRQLAAVELRKKLSKSSASWSKQPVEIRTGIKTKLLEIAALESAAAMRNSLACVINEIACKELPHNMWPELLPWMFESAESPNAVQRQTAMLVLFYVLETFVDSEELKSHLPRIMALFAKGIQDPESLEVRVTTVRALSKVAENIDSDDQADLAALQSALPQMILVLQQCLDNTFSEGVRQILDVFENMCMLEAPILSAHLSELVACFVQNSANRDHEEDLRLMCLNSLVWTIQYKRSRIQSTGLAKPMIEKLMPVATEEDSDDVEEDTPSRLALRVIDQLATELPPNHVFPVLFEQVQAYANNPDAMHRKAAMMAFGVSVEGCSEYIRPHMNELLPFVEHGMKDESPVVRKASCITLGCLCEMLDDECAAKHAVFLPLIMELINAPETQRPACTALDALLEVMGDDIAQYLPAIMERLTGLLETAPIAVKATITGAIGSAAHAAKEGFAPYFPALMQRVQPFLALTEEGEEIDLRGITTDTIGTFAEAVGADMFRPYLPDMMRVTVESLAMDEPRLRECAYIFFAVMSRVFKEDFGPYLEHVVPKMLASFSQSEHEGMDDGAAALSYGGGDDEDDGFVDMEELTNSFLNVSTAVAIEKEVAADSLGELFQFTRGAFLPYLEKATEELIGVTTHFYQGIRKSAVASLFTFISTLHSLCDSPAWVPGDANGVQLDPNVEKIAQVIMPAIMETWEAEDDRTAAIEICQSFASCLNKCGPGLISPQWIEPTCQLTMQILEKKAPSQIDPEADEDEETEDSSEYESVLISAAMDLVGAMAYVLCDSFMTPMRQFLPLLCKYYSPGRSVTDRATAIGSLGEITVNMKRAITPFTQDILAILSHAVGDEDASVRSNAAFAAGVLIEHSDSDLSQHYMPLLTALQSYFHKSSGESDELKTARDNACGCLARMMIKDANAVPLDQALPVLFSALPLEKDYAEWTPILLCMIQLIQTNNPVAMQHVDTILQLFRHVLSSDEDMLGGQLRGQLVAFVSQLHSQAPEKISANGLDAFLV